MRKSLLILLVLVTSTSNLNPLHASTPFSQVSNNKHQYFDTALSLSQSNESKTGFTNGILNVQLDITNIQAEFLEYIPGQSMNCYVDFSPQWDTYFELNYQALISEDPKFEDSTPYVNIMANLKMDIDGEIIWNSSNPNIPFSIQDYREDRDEEFSLNEVATPKNSGISTKVFSIPVEGGKTYYLYESLSFYENVDCINRNIGGAELGIRIIKESSFEVENALQTISVNFPNKSVALKEQAVRISFSATSKLPVDAMEMTPSICIVNGTVVLLKGAGTCRIEFKQAGGNGFAPVTHSSSFEITSNSRSSTIVCIKGKTKKNVTGINPKCPAGYKKK